MAARNRVESVTTSATALNDVGDALIYNDGAVTVYVGGPMVTTSGATKGLPLLPGDSIPIDGQGDVLYGIVATGTCDVIVLEVGV